MDHGILKHWPALCLAAATGLSVVVFKLVMRPSAEALHPEEQSYEMGRPKPVSGGYDLSGRRVVRQVYSLPGAQTKHPAKPAAGVAPAPKTAKNDGGAKARMDAKKKMAEAMAKKAKAKAQMEAQAQARRRAELAIRISEMAKADMLKMKSPENRLEKQAAAAPQGYAAPTAAAAPDVADDKEEKQKLSPDQWKSRLHAQPTEKNAADFVAAFHNNEVDARTFYDVARMLVLDSSTERQNLGLYMLKQDTSPTTFSFLVKASNGSKTPESVKTQISAILKSYGESSKLSSLNRSLLDSDPETAKMAASILDDVVKHQSVSVQENVGRDARSPGSTAVAKSQLQTFIPTLRRLASSQNQELAQQAQDLLTRIQALKTAA